MNIIIHNAEDARDYIDKMKGPIMAELIFSRLMEEPEQLRIKLYEMLIREEKADLR